MSTQTTPELPANIVELAKRTKAETPAAAKRRIVREQAAADKVAASMAEFQAAHEPKVRKPRASKADALAARRIDKAMAADPDAPKAPAKKRDTSIKTWTLVAAQVRAAIAEIRTRMGDEAKGAKFEIGTRTLPVYATTKTEAKVTPKGDDLVERYSIENGTNLPEVRGHGYVAHLYVSRRGEHVSTWTVWLAADEFVILTADGKAVK